MAVMTAVDERDQKAQVGSHFPRCPQALTDEQREQFDRDGFLAFTHVLTPDEVQKARDGITELVLRLAHDPSINKHGPLWSPEGKRICVQFEPGFAPQGADDAELELKVRKLMWYQEEHSHFAYLAKEQQNVQGILTTLMGESPLLYSDQAMIKPAHIGSEKPWHQDNAYFDVTPLEAVCGCWIALEDATVENGCMHVLAGQHKRGALRHHHTHDCEIVSDRIDPSLAVPVELPAGGAMFFSGLLPHQTPPNRTPSRRRALQFHYRATSSTIIEKEDYLKIFAEADGSPASCYAAQAPKI